jgi:hypothetical protein
MPLYVCRWNNGDCSFVTARTKQLAIEALDEVENAEGCPIRRVDDFQVHFRLADDGSLEFEHFGEETEELLSDVLYPHLNKTLSEVHRERDESGATDFTPEQQERILEATRRERQRVRGKPALAPDTELGKEIKARADMATSLVNKLVKQAATKRLKELPDDDPQ